MLVRLGAIAFILFVKYSDKLSLYSANSMIYYARLRMNYSSCWLISVPIDISAASLTSFSISSGTMDDKSELWKLVL